MQSRKDALFQQRLAKLQRLRDRGIDPYPHCFSPSHTVQQALSLWQGGQPPPDLTLAGRIVAQRSMGKIAFLDLRDGSGKLQVYFKAEDLGERYGLLKELDLGDFLGARGSLFTTRTGEVTLAAKDFTVLAKALQPLPEKWHGLADVETRFRQRYLDLIANPEVKPVFLMRSRIISGIRRFLDQRGFVEVETPILVPVAAGALARPFTTHHNTLDQDLYLRIATELYLKRLIVGGLDRVYEIGRVFRNEGVDQDHNPEFTLLESYQAYADYNDVMQMVEEMVSTVAHDVLGATQVKRGDQTIDLAPPWKRLPFLEAVHRHSGIDLEPYIRSGKPLQDLVALGRERGLDLGATTSFKVFDKIFSLAVEPNLVQPTFVVDYPKDMAPLAKDKRGDPALVEKFEGFAAGMELANAYTELNDPREQRSRFLGQEQWRKQFGEEETERTDEDFLEALEHGMPPTGGLGIGIDRLVMLLTGQPSIREVIFFPQLKSKE